MVVVSPLNDFGLADLFRIPSLYFDTVNMLGRDLEKLLFSTASDCKQPV